METPFPCPECGAEHLELLEACEVEEIYVPPFFVNDGRPLPRRQKIADVAACSACEFAIQITVAR